MTYHSSDKCRSIGVDSRSAILICAREIHRVRPLLVQVDLQCVCVYHCTIIFQMVWENLYGVFFQQRHVFAPLPCQLLSKLGRISR